MRKRTAAAAAAAAVVAMSTTVKEEPVAAVAAAAATAAAAKKVKVKEEPDSPKRARRTEIKIEYEEEKKIEATTATTLTTAAKGTGSAPTRWEAQWEGIAEMRAKRGAPVDTLGCAHQADPGAPAQVRRFQTLVALMLSSQTKDPVTAAAMTALRAHGCTVDNIIATDVNTINSLISKVGFHNKKAVYIKEVARTLRDQHGGDIPRTAEEIMALPGVGPKMAYLCMLSAWGDATAGIGVDVHVHRIAQRLRWVSSKVKGPEDTRVQLQSWLPLDRWSKINEMLVGFGQTVCLPIGPKCSECKINGICPSSSHRPKKEKKENP